MIMSSIVKGTPKWGQRSHTCVSDFLENAIIFVMEKGALKNVKSAKDDWRVGLMSKLTELTQANDSAFLPII